MNQIKIKSKILFIVLNTMLVSFFVLCFNSYAENVNLSYNYGIKNMAKDINDLPFNISIENKDSQVFNGYVAINVFENNNSIYTYKINVSIPEKTTSSYSRNISVSNYTNTVVINLYNRREDLIVSERTSVDLSYFNDKFLIGAISNDFNSLSYIDNASIANSNLQIKLTDLKIDDIIINNKIINVLDMLIITGLNKEENINSINNALFSFSSNNKPIVICIDGNINSNSIPDFLHNYIYDSNTRTNIISNLDKVYDDNGNILAYHINTNSLNVILTNLNFLSISKQNDAANIFLKFLEKSVDANYFIKLSNNYYATLKNDYYNISNLLNMIDRYKLPDIFILTILLLFYVVFITVILYVLLRNINKLNLYGKLTILFSIFYTVIMFTIGLPMMKKDTFLTYLSIVNIKNSNAKEMAFLNFRKSESGNYSFDTNKDNVINPILKKNKDPIVSFNFINRNEIMNTTFTEENDRTNIFVENANDFNSNVFIYKHDNYLNDIYSIDASYKRFDKEIVGRVTNNMNLNLKNASLLLYGKVLKIGDIESNHSISLSRAKAIGASVGNNTMLADIISDANNRNIVKYYLDENLMGYYDYGLLFGFIDNNLSIDINSSDVGEVYGRTLIVTKIDNDFIDLSNNAKDYCSLENEVYSLEGNYDYISNTTDGNSIVINEYAFDSSLNISKIYIETMDSYDYGQIEYNVPFYGNIDIFNYNSNVYESYSEDIINASGIDNYIKQNKIILRFTPTLKDPLYRKISLPILRAIASK